MALHRWVGDNGPRPTDWEANSNLINIAAGAMKAAQGDLARFVFVTSAGVERQKELPWAILNLYGASGVSDALPAVSRCGALVFKPGWCALGTLTACVPRRCATKGWSQRAHAAQTAACIGTLCGTLCGTALSAWYTLGCPPMPAFWAAQARLI